MLVYWNIFRDDIAETARIGCPPRDHTEANWIRHAGIGSGMLDTDGLD